MYSTTAACHQHAGQTSHLAPLPATPTMPGLSRPETSFKTLALNRANMKCMQNKLLYESTLSSLAKMTAASRQSVIITYDDNVPARPPSAKSSNPLPTPSTPIGSCQFSLINSAPPDESPPPIPSTVAPSDDRNDQVYEQLKLLQLNTVGLAPPSKTSNNNQVHYESITTSSSLLSRTPNPVDIDVSDQAKSAERENIPSTAVEHCESSHNPIVTPSSDQSQRNHEQSAYGIASSDTPIESLPPPQPPPPPSSTSLLHYAASRNLLQLMNKLIQVDKMNIDTIDAVSGTIRSVCTMISACSNRIGSCEMERNISICSEPPTAFDRDHPSTRECNVFTKNKGACSMDSLCGKHRGSGQLPLPPIEPKFDRGLIE